MKDRAARNAIFSAFFVVGLCWVAIGAWSSGYQLGTDIALKQKAHIVGSAK